MIQGIKVALPGLDATTAPDYQLLFSSQWPNIKIFNTVIVSIQSVATLDNNNNIIYQHGLGFPPAVVPFTMNNQAEIGTGTIGEATGVLSVDDQNVYLVSATPPSSMGLLIFYIDITQPFTAPIVNTGGSQPIATNATLKYGIRIAKANKTVSDPDVRNFVLRSDCRSPMVHAVVQGIIGAGQQFVYQYDLLYNPIFFAYIQVPNTNQYAFANSYSAIGTVGSSITVGGIAGLAVSIVILQDPFIITDNVQSISV